MMPSHNSQHDIEDTYVPDGYVLVLDSEGQRYLVPEFLASDLKQRLLGHTKKTDLRIDEASGNVSGL